MAEDFVTAVTSFFGVGSSNENGNSEKDRDRAQTRKSIVSKRVSLHFSVEEFLSRCNANTTSFCESYELGKLLYEAEFCHIHACTHIETDRPRIVKIVRETSSSSSSCHEFEILKRLDHPNIPAVYQLYSEEFELSMVMERCFGASLSAELQTQGGGTLEEKVCKKILFQILKCLIYLHDTALVVHCGVGPQHILLDHPHDFTKVQLIDFDAAVKLQEKGDKIHSKQWGGKGHDIVYQAPEVFENQPKYDGKADVWACGVLLYRMLYNKLPFVEGKDDTEEEILERMIAGDVNFPDRHWVSISQDAKDCIQEILTVRTNRRPSAAKALSHNWFKDAGHHKRADLSSPHNPTSAQVRLSMTALSNMCRHNPSFVMK